MNQVILCYGKYAKSPYYIGEECLNIFSVEELCYFICNNAYLLEDTFISEKLIQWIEKELNLTSLAERLAYVQGKRDGFCESIVILLEEVGYYNKDEIQQIIKIIKEHNHLSIQEKRKARADGLLHNNKFSMAADEYGILLKETDETQVKLRAKVYHNLGVCFANQFLFKKASQYFKRAYDTYANTESYIQFLSSLKMGIEPSEYLTYLAEHKESYEDSLEVESKIESLKQQWRIQLMAKKVKDLREQKDKGNPYYNDIDSMAEKVKEEYRNIIFRNSNI